VTAAAVHGRRLVVAADARAAAGGIAPGMPLAAAQALVPDLAVVAADPQGDLAALGRLAGWAMQRHAPLVALDPPSGLWLDISGCAGLFGGERALLADLCRRLGRFGVAARAAVADTAGCAHALAHQPGPPLAVVPPGGQRAALAPLPVAALRLEPATVAALRALGFERIGQLLAVPRAPLARRFGLALFERLDQALGDLPEPLLPILPQRWPQQRLAFAEPLLTAEALAMAVERLVAALVARLAALGEGVRRLECRFHRLDGARPTIRVGTVAPSREVTRLVRLLLLRLETVAPEPGIEAMTLVATRTAPLSPRQEESGLGAAPPAADLSALVETLAARFGEAALYRAAPEAGGMPERTVGRVAALAPAAGAGWDAAFPRPARLLGRPEPVRAVALLPDLPPAMFQWRGRSFRVLRADGPERLQGEWWREAGHEADFPLSVRDYYLVETEGGGRYWLFRLGDGAAPAGWFLHGAFA
jgi:protein ImuB